MAKSVKYNVKMYVLIPQLVRVLATKFQSFFLAINFPFFCYYYSHHPFCFVSYLALLGRVASCFIVQNELYDIDTSATLLASGELCTLRQKLPCHAGMCVCVCARAQKRTRIRQKKYDSISVVSSSLFKQK